MIFNDACFEQIRGNFYYGRFENFFTLVIDKNTLYFNATKLCKDMNKDFKDWTELERSKELIKYYKSRKMSISYGITFHILGEDEINKILTGHYVHKYLLFDIASWLSPEFYFTFFNNIQQSDDDRPTRGTGRPPGSITPRRAAGLKGSVGRTRRVSALLDRTPSATPAERAPLPLDPPLALQAGPSKEPAKGTPWDNVRGLKGAR